MRDLATEQPVRDDPDDLAPRIDDRVGEPAHHPYLCAAVDQPDLTFGEQAPQRIGEVVDAGPVAVG